MRNLRAVAASLKPLFENPEIGAMAEICEILKALPDDAARLRVMRWSFARFGGEEFKRSVPNLAQQAVVTQYAPETQYQSEARDEPEFVEAPVSQDTEAFGEDADQDFAHQVSELKDLFPQRAALVVKKRQPV